VILYLTNTVLLISLLVKGH